MDRQTSTPQPVYGTASIIDGFMGSIGFVVALVLIAWCIV